jgi:hypothetical protein
MANLIDTTYFVYDCDLPTGSAYSDVTNFITRYEKEILTDLLGYELYTLVAASTELSGRLYDLINGKEYTKQYNGRDQKVKWNGLKNTDKISLIAYYVYYRYQLAKATLPGGSGELKPKVENGVNAELANKVMDAWHRMRELYGYEGQDILAPSAYNFLTKYATTYPEWVFTEIGKVNGFDL